MPRLPKYVNGYVDRHGKPRFYFRRRGFKHVALPSLPWSPEFMAAYEVALAGQDRIEIGAGRTMPGTIRALATSYFASPEFRLGLRPSTQSGYRGAIERLCKEHGDKRVATLQREHVVRSACGQGRKARGSK